MKHFFSILFLLVFLSLLVKAQETSNLRSKTIVWTGDSMVLDTLSLVPGSVELRDRNMQVIDTSNFVVKPFRSTIYRKPGSSIEDGIPINVYYRAYPFNLAQEFKHKDIALIEPDQDVLQNPFAYTPERETVDFFELEGLNKSGSISRGVSLGNNQDLAVNSNLDLQLAGKLTDDVKILAAISDGNLPIQPEGNTQQLQEFDQVYIQLYNDKYKLIAGDYRVENKETNHFLKYKKSLQGGSAHARFVIDTTGKEFAQHQEYYAGVSAAISKGKFALNKIQGQEGNQGPYQLRGAENETFIVVISGTEKVYIDGKLMKRGQNYDYIIDYNTAELTFTPNQLITKDKRITVQFQYSDRYYARTFYHVNGGYKNEKFELDVNYYNEGDNKNQPLDRDFTNEEKAILAAVGDSIDGALVPNVTFDTTADLSTEILYKLVYETQNFGPDSHFVYSTNPDSAVWRVGFAFLGEGKGDYILASSDANGKVFQFVPRISATEFGGSYMPLTTIVTPKRRQMITAGGKYQFAKTSDLKFEGAYSTNDLNTFSSEDDGDNDGFGIMLHQDNSFPLQGGEQPLYFDVGGGYELASAQFKEIERFRTVEFYRDWNLPQPTGDDPKGLENDQHVGDVYLGLSKEGLGFLRYTASTFQEQDVYDGYNNKLNGNLEYEGLKARLDGSYVLSSGAYNSSFLRYNAEVSQRFWKTRAGVEFEEENSQRLSESGDSLIDGSFRWNWWKVFIENNDSTGNGYQVFYVNRYDWLPGQDRSRLEMANFAEDVGAEFYLQRNPKHQFLAKATYRKLEIVDSNVSINEPEENILGKLDYRGLFLKRTLQWQSYYEIGSGLEIKKEVRFEGPVEPGQGSYAWNDLNDDGIQQKNEFFLAPTPQEGIYVRVLLPTNEFERAYTNSFNQVIFIKPEVVLGNKKGMAKMLSYLSNRFTYRIDKKSNEDNVYNPFQFNFESDSLLSLSNSILNTFYINRLGTVFGIELNYRENNNRNFLVSGKETRANTTRGIRTRWNITTQVTFNTEYEEGRSQAFSENFADRNFDIRSNAILPELYYQPGIAFRIGANYRYEEQFNSVDYGGQKAINNDIGLELRYNVAQKGSFQLNFNYILIDFIGEDDPAITTEMLEGLLPGRNATWSLLFQRNLGRYMQLSVNYSGRQSEGSNMVHLGGAQVRAFF